MKLKNFFYYISFAFFTAVSPIFAAQEVFLGGEPMISPNGKEFLFSWDKQIYSAPLIGGAARQITFHPAGSSRPLYSPDGENIYFHSTRDDGRQIYSIPLSSGDVKKHTFHTDGYTLVDVFPDGKNALAVAWRDFNGLIGKRLLIVSLDNSVRDKVLFDDYASEAVVSPDGENVLFTRDGVDVHRQGYLGSAVSQIWIYNIKSKIFKCLLKERWANREPFWNPTGKSFYYISEEDGSFNIWEYFLESEKKEQLTFMKDSPILMPSISKDGKTILFRHLLDFYTFNPIRKTIPKMTKVTVPPGLATDTYRRWYDRIWNENTYGKIDFTDDGLEFAFTTGGNLYVSDTVIRNPILVDGNSSDFIGELCFSSDYKTIYYLKDTGDAVNIWEAKVSDSEKYWWENSKFKTKQLTFGKDNLSKLGVSPDGKKISFFKRRGALCVYDIESKNETLLKEVAYEHSHYIWAPDSFHILASLSSDSENSNVWILTIDNSSKPYNLSRTPKYSGSMSWSPDGKVITYITATTDNKIEFNWLYLDKIDDEETADDRAIARALKVMENSRGKREIQEKKDESPAPIDQLQPKAPVSENEEKDEQSEKENKAVIAKKIQRIKEKKGDDTLMQRNGGIIKIEYNNLYKRVHKRIVNWSNPWGFFWSMDSKLLAFSTNINGKSGTYSLNFPEPNFNPVFITGKAGWYGKWTKSGQINWSINGVPAHLNSEFPIKIYQVINRYERQKLEFRIIWRAMRDNFCDPNIKFINWDNMRTKYEEAAGKSPNRAIFNRIIGLLLGELNASHLGFIPNQQPPVWENSNWQVETANFGVYFDQEYHENGLKVKKIITDGPADLDRSRLYVGDIIKEINGNKITTSTNVAKITTNRPDFEYVLKILGTDNKERSVVIKPINFHQARELVKEQKIIDNREIVEKLSNNKIGYLNIERMYYPSLRRFENEIYSEGYGKDGLIIDVRNNPGGFTSDYLLSILCHPEHAVTIPRNGGMSYPDGYLPNVVWQKPIVVLCNQYSCSNAEIFSHAIKTLKRGKIVGVETQACVISTPRKKILDIGELAIPDRAWWPLGTLVDMEKQGAVPDVTIWPEPGDMPKGVDRQLEKGIEILLEDIKNIPQDPILTRQGHKEIINKKTTEKKDSLTP